MFWYGMQEPPVVLNPAEEDPATKRFATGPYQCKKCRSFGVDEECWYCGNETARVTMRNMPGSQMAWRPDGVVQNPFGDNDEADAGRSWAEFVESL